MTDVAIRCEGLAKQYRIGERESYKALRDVITAAFASPFRRLRSNLPHSSNGSAGSKAPNFWALKDVSFEIERGEVVGIIGRNGAGKSTLLKILSRITEPTLGHADIWGRVGSLLEVGTGFHPELTGRDNIFLNGAILGMKRTEIARKFDEIVAFAEVEKFIDTPVKRYSSGMYVRLAFAVAAHMETEILLVDEVLAVGDSEFQKKCLRKMGDVAKQGRTVLFVSHNMIMVQRLCSDGLLLRDGRVVFQGRSGECMRYYSELLEQNTSANAAVSADGSLAIHSVGVLDDNGSPTETWVYGQPITVEVRLRARAPVPKIAVDITFYSVGGLRLFGIQSDRWPYSSLHGTGEYKIAFRIESPGLSVPEMYLDVGLRTAAAGYEALLTCAAYLFVKADDLPHYAAFQNLLTPSVEVRWEQTEFTGFSDGG